MTGGSVVGDGCVLELVTDALGDQKWNFRHENQLGSLIGMTNLAGRRTTELDYGEYGQTYMKNMVWAGAVDVANTQSVGATTTRVYALAGSEIPLEAINGLVRCAHPGAAEHASFGTVLDVGFDPMLLESYMDVEDLEDKVLNAIKEIGCDVTVLGNYGNVAPPTEPVASGHWDDVVYDSLTDTTTFTDFGTAYPPETVNWWLQPDAARSTYLDIVSVGNGVIVVAGNAEGLAHGLIPQPPLDPILGTFYCIIWPVGVDPATGTLAHDDPCNPASRVLFAGYYYMPPVAGTLVAPPGGGGDSAYQQPAWQLLSSKYRQPQGPGLQLLAIAPPGTVYGRQPGNNLRGDYYCWNRILSPTTGRWTTPDAAQQYINLFSYVGENPTRLTDASGLVTATETSGAGADPWKAEGYTKKFRFKDKANTILVQHVIRTHYFWCDGDKYYRKILKYEYAEWFLTDAAGKTDEDIHSANINSYNDLVNGMTKACPGCPCPLPRYKVTNRFEIQRGTLSPGAQVAGKKFGYLSSWVDQAGISHDSKLTEKSRCPGDLKYTTVTTNFPSLEGGSSTKNLGKGMVCSPKTGPGVMRVRDGLEAGKDCHETQATHTRTDHRPAA